MWFWWFCCWFCCNCWNFTWLRWLLFCAIIPACCCCCCCCCNCCKMWAWLAICALTDCGCCCSCCWGQKVDSFLIFWRRFRSRSGATVLVTVTLLFHWSHVTLSTSAPPLPNFKMRILASMHFGYLNQGWIKDLQNAMVEQWYNLGHFLIFWLGWPGWLSQVLD